MKNVEKDIGLNIIKVKEIFDKSKENQDNYKFLYSELNIFKEKLEKMKIENQSRNELNNILRDSFGRINEIVPQIYYEETNIKSNFDLPRQYNANEQLYKNRTLNQNINFNQNNDLFLVNNNKTDFPVKNAILNNTNSKYNSEANNQDYNPNQNLLLINNHSGVNNIKNITKKNSFLDKNYILKDNSINMNSPNQAKLFGNIKSNAIDIACLESNIFSDMSTENSKLLESRKMNFPRQNINSIHTNKAFNNNNNNKGKTLLSENQIFNSSQNLNQNSNYNNFNQRNPHQEQMFFDSYNNNNKINNENLTSRDINDITKYESIQYDYSASIDLKKIDSRDFQNLEQINEERSEYSIPENYKNVNYYNYNYNVLPKENDNYTNINSSRKNDNENIKSVFSKNRKMEVAKFNEILVNNFTYSNNNCINNGHLYNNINNNNSSFFNNN